MPLILKCPHCDNIVDTLIPVDITRKYEVEPSNSVRHWLTYGRWEGRLPTSEVYSRYIEWCQSGWEAQPVSHKKFVLDLVALGARRVKGNKGKRFLELPHD